MRAHQNTLSSMKARTRPGASILWLFLAALLAVHAGCRSTANNVNLQDPCDGILCSGHGRCIPIDEADIAAPPADRAAMCVCDTGYRADGLECVPYDPSDPCAGINCSGRGRCELAGEALSDQVPVCICEEGAYADGLDCLPIDSANPCRGVTCSGHGECIGRSVDGADSDDVTAGDTVFAPACACDEGYVEVGLGCAPDPCSGVSCGGHGTCQVDTASGEPLPFCRCEPGFYPHGPLCVDPCEGVTCGGHGICQTESAAISAQGAEAVPTCVCEPSYRAQGLECVPDPCDGVTCGGHGRCEVLDMTAGGSPSCVCEQGYRAEGLSCVLLPCNPTTCPTGCCDAENVCRPGSTSDACGGGGRTCASCPGPWACDAGICRLAPTASRKWIRNIRATGVRWTDEPGSSPEWGDLPTAPFHKGIQTGLRLASAGFNTAINWGFHFRLRDDPPPNNWPSVGQMLPAIRDFTQGVHQSGVYVVEHHSAGLFFEQNQRINGRPKTDVCQVDAFGPPDVCPAENHHHFFCPNRAAARDAYRLHVQDLFNQTGIDGLQPDDIGFQRFFDSGGGRKRYGCHCASCQAAYRNFEGGVHNIAPELAGYDPDFWNNVHDGEFRAWIRFRLSSVGEWYDWLRNDVMSSIPAAQRAPMWACQAALSGTFTRENGISSEKLEESSNLVFFEQISLGGSSSSNDSFGYFHTWSRMIPDIEIAKSIARPNDKPVLVLRYSKEGGTGEKCERSFSWMLDRAFGVSSWHQGTEHQADVSGDPHLAALVQWEAARPDLFSPAERPATVGILFSAQSRDNRPQAAYEFWGWAHSLLTQNIPFVVLRDDDVLTEGLATSLDVLILPDVSCISKAQQLAIEKLIEGGIKVIASGPSFGLYNKYGAPWSKRWIPAGITAYYSGTPGQNALPTYESRASGTGLRVTVSEASLSYTQTLANIVRAFTPNRPLKVVSAPRGIIATLIMPQADSVTMGQPKYLVHLINATGSAFVQCVNPPCTIPREGHDVDFPQINNATIQLSIAGGPYRATLHSADESAPFDLGTTNGNNLSVAGVHVRRYAVIALYEP
ncbi:MAG: hypothetical protein JW741_16725 [Sedimentisphaerales bacterium]|nr:hypothetical protein [Sedimentisphaerales bacterium]